VAPDYVGWLGLFVANHSFIIIIIITYYFFFFLVCIGKKTRDGIVAGMKKYIREFYGEDPQQVRILLIQNLKIFHFFIFFLERKLWKNHFSLCVSAFAGTVEGRDHLNGRTV
jgi:hypothetical protein